MQYSDYLNSKEDFLHTNQPSFIRVFLISASGEMEPVWLQEPPTGRYYFEKCDVKIRDLVYIEAKNGKWCICCNKPAFLRNAQDKSKEVFYELEIYDQCLFSVGNLGMKYGIYAEQFTQDKLVYHNYQVRKSTDIYIGKIDDNDIVYPNRYVSKTHATLRWDDPSWTIRDEGSQNGIFVNHKKVQETSLKAGDIVDIMATRIIIGIGFISINDGGNRVKVKMDKLGPILSANQMNFLNVPKRENKDMALFNRLPRRRHLLEPSKIEIQAPPISLNSNNIPLLLRMGSPLVMSSASMLSGNFTMMITSVLFPVLTQRYTDKQRKEYEIRRTTKYNEYLDVKRTEIQKELRKEQNALESNYPELSTVLAYVKDGEKLWERRKADDDFLTLRLGSGRVPLLAEYEYSRREFEMEEDPLMDEMYALAEEPVWIEHAPIMTSFVQNFVCGVLGKRSRTLSFVKGLIMQMVVLHSYDELKLVFLGRDDELEEMEFVRYLPHIWTDQKDFRFLATSTGEAYQISEYLANEISESISNQMDLKAISDILPPPKRWGLLAQVP